MNIDIVKEYRRGVAVRDSYGDFLCHKAIEKKLDKLGEKRAHTLKEKLKKEAGNKKKILTFHY